MYCTHCGAQIDDEARFCTECGVPVERPEAPEGARQPDSVCLAEPLEPTQDVVQQKPTRPQAETPATPSAAQKRRKKAPALAAALLCIAVIGAGSAIFLASRGGSVAAPAPRKVDEQQFPDEGLRYFVSQVVDADGDGELSVDELSSVTDATIDGAQSLSGLGALFPNLVSLTVTGGELEDLDVSDCAQVERIDVSYEPISSLDVSQNKKLTDLDVTGTDIDSIDVSGNPDLSQIAADDSTTVTGTEATQVQQVWVATSVSEEYSSGMTAYYDVDIDDSGRVAQASYGVPGYRSATIDYSYDSQGRLIEANDHEYTMNTYSYDDSGMLSKVSTKYDTYSASYDNGLLSSVTDGSGMASTCVYDAEGRLSSLTDGSISYEYDYDDAGRLSAESLCAEGGGDPIVTTYEYDQDGNLVRLTSTGATSEFSGGDIQAEYDDEGRITSVSAPGFGLDEEFSYDENGNLLEVSCSRNGSSTTWTVEYERRFVPKDQEAPSRGLRLEPLLDPTSLVMSQSCIVYVDAAADAPGVPDNTYVSSILRVKQELYMQ